MKRNVEQYDYQELNEVREVLEALGLPKGLINPRCVMAFAAIAEIKHGKWNKISENYKGMHIPAGWCSQPAGIFTLQTYLHELLA